MAKVLLSLHVIAGIVFVGPVTVAVSLFPRYARLAADPGRREAAMPVLVLLRRISTVYAVLGLSVPAFGVGVAARLGVLGDTWLVVAMVLTGVAAILLAVAILPAQQELMEVLADPESPLTATGAYRAAGGGDPVRAVWHSSTRRLAGLGGMFALIWAVVVVLMIVRPGSTTGV